MNQNTGGHFKLMSHVVRLSSFHANEGCLELLENSFLDTKFISVLHIVSNLYAHPFLVVTFK